jgi:hypothetical protein
MSRTIQALALVSLTLLLAGPVYAEDVPNESERVIAAFQAALDNHDQARAAAFFADDARAMVPTVVEGRDNIASWLGWHYPSDSSVEVSTYAATGQRVSWMARVTHGWGSVYPRFQVTWDEAVVVNGQITLWTSRAIADTTAMTPQFRRARSVAPIVPAPMVARRQTLAVPQWTLLIGGVLVAGVLGATYGVGRVRRDPARERQRQGGEMLRTLHSRIVASNRSVLS